VINVVKGYLSQYRLGYGVDDRVKFPAGAMMWFFSLDHHVQTGSGTHPASYPSCAGRSFRGGKPAGAWSWPLTSS